MLTLVGVGRLVTLAGLCAGLLRVAYAWSCLGGGCLRAGGHLGGYCRFNWADCSVQLKLMGGGCHVAARAFLTLLPIGLSAPRMQGLVSAFCGRAGG